MSELKTFRVGTFFHPEHGAATRRYSAYTTWYNAHWPDCVEFEIQAVDGKEAKRLARIKRHELEESKKPGAA